MLTNKVQCILEKPLKPLKPYIINTKQIVIQFMLTRHIQFMSIILLFLCCLFKSYLCIQFNFSLCLVGVSLWKIQFLKYLNQENIKADKSNQLRNNSGRCRKV